MKKLNVKEFWKKNKAKIVFVGGTIVLIGGTITRLAISGKDHSGFIDLEKPDINGDIKVFAKHKEGSCNIAIGSLHHVEDVGDLANKLAKAAEFNDENGVDCVIGIGKFES